MSMTPEKLRSLSREEALFLVAHEIMHRLLEIEPNAIATDKDSGRSGVLVFTDEGKALAKVLGLIDTMVRVQ